MPSGGPVLSRTIPSVYHGEQAELAALLRDDLFDLPDDEFALLHDACVRHRDGLREGDLTIQTCWDADRLDLARVRIPPNPQRLCTAAAKRPDILKWADGRAAFEIVPEFVAAEWGIDLGDDPR